jgi:hypothetical protein
MLRNALFALSIAALGGAVSAQQCATLGVTGTGAPGTTLTFSLDGSTPNAFAFLVVGAAQGSLAVDLGPIGSLTLGVLPDFILPLGATDLAGDASLAANVPPAPVPGQDLFGQGVTLGFTLPTVPPTGIPNLAWTLCVSNVVSFHYGS